MRLTDLNPEFVDGGVGSPGRTGVMLMFDCPKCGADGVRHGGVGCYLDPPMDGGAPVSDHSWKRSGDSFENLTLTPSILVVATNGIGCGWHGYITNGEIIEA